MALIVQKYGGSSLADADKIKNVAKRIASTKEKGNDVVAVVSAMGNTTDNLLRLAQQIHSEPDEREVDVLLSTGEIISATLVAMALRSLWYDAVSLSGAQAGIFTDKIHRRARISKIEPERILKELKSGKIVIVAGFQGMTLEMDTTTLGRGGSDTTAVALAIALHAGACHIYTDVEGVFTADPRLVPDAVKINEIGYEEMLELASYGSKVMHNRAVELGEIYSMPILVASSFTENPGTLIHGGIPMEIRNKVRGIAQDLNVAKITILGLPDKPGVAAQIFQALADADISVDTIVQNASVNNLADLTFTVTRTDLSKALRTIDPLAKKLKARECKSDTNLGKVSIVGSGMQNTPGYAAKMFTTLSAENINIQLITTAEIRITCIIEEGMMNKAVQALHKAFELDKTAA
ncbi:MAG: aspartate kinase [Dehalococcoidia bacterium]|nr:aspartate kinase [Dehalococcoidia bacterium]